MEPLGKADRSVVSQTDVGCLCLFNSGRGIGDFFAVLDTLVIGSSCRNLRLAVFSDLVARQTLVTGGLADITSVDGMAISSSRANDIDGSFA